MSNSFDFVTDDSSSSPITLMDGSVIYGFEKSGDETAETIDNVMTLDTTGTYLVLSAKKKSTQSKPEADAQAEEAMRLFCENAALFLSHREAILRDSKLFLTPVAARNGLAYTGTGGFRHPTLGVYIEWWLNCRAAITFHGDCYWLACQFGGSPLSGANTTLAVNVKGETRRFQSCDFASMWKSFSAINTRYDEAKQKYQSYTLEQAIDILKQTAQPAAPVQANLDLFFANRDIQNLYAFIDQQKKDIRQYRKEITELLIYKHHASVAALYRQFSEASAKAQSEVDRCRQQWAELRMRLKDGQITNNHYQKLVSPLHKVIKYAMNQVISEYVQKCQEIDQRLFLWDVTEYFEERKPALPKTLSAAELLEDLLLYADQHTRWDRFMSHCKSERLQANALNKGLRFAWTTSSTIDMRQAWECFAANADMSLIMSHAEQQYYESLPKRVELYRACSLEEYADYVAGNGTLGIGWTTSLAEAERCVVADGSQGSVVVKICAHKDFFQALFLHGGAAEVIITATSNFPPTLVSASPTSPSRPD